MEFAILIVTFMSGISVGMAIIRYLQWKAV